MQFISFDQKVLSLSLSSLSSLYLFSLSLFFLSLSSFSLLSLSLSLPHILMFLIAKLPMVVVGTKSDLPRVVSKAELASFAQVNWPYLFLPYPTYPTLSFPPIPHFSFLSFFLFISDPLPSLSQPNLEKWIPLPRSISQRRRKHRRSL